MTEGSKGPVHLFLIYAQGGMGKSTLLAQLAAYVKKHRGLKTRIIGADGGGTKAFKPLMDKGIVDYWPIDLWDEKSMFHTLDFATKGYWPSDVDTPNSDLLPPTKEFRPCNKCEKDSGSVGLAQVAKCIACGETFGPGVRLPKKIELIDGAEEVGATCLEGATAFGNLLLNRLKKQDPTNGYNVKDGDAIISAPGQNHYGMAQSYMAQYVGNTRKLPYEFAAWTALEIRGKGETDEKPIFGPKFPGKALTEACIPWFTDVFHVDGQATKGADGIEVLKRKIFTAKHFPEDTKPYGFAAKGSAPLAGNLPVVFDFPPTGNTMDKYFSELALANERAAEALLA
jgi:hypothetical protein